MVDEFKSIRNNLLKTLTGISITTRTGFGDDEDDTEADEGSESSGRGDILAARALFGALFAKAGKSKDEIVQIIAREIGMTVAAMLKEPLAQIAKHQKLQISFELVPKSSDTSHAKDAPISKDPPVRKRRRSKRPSRHTNSAKGGD